MISFLPPFLAALFMSSLGGGVPTGSTVEEVSTVAGTAATTTPGPVVCTAQPRAPPASTPRPQLNDRLLALAESCKSFAKITSDQMNLIASETIPKTEDEKCFLQCVYDGIGMTKDGKLFEDGAKALAKERFSSSPEQLLKTNTAIDLCAKEVVVKDTSERCGISRLVRECMVKYGAKGKTGLWANSTITSQAT